MWGQHLRIYSVSAGILVINELLITMINNLKKRSINTNSNLKQGSHSAKENSDKFKLLKRNVSFLILYYNISVKIRWLFSLSPVSEWEWRGPCCSQLTFQIQRRFREDTVYLISTPGDGVCVQWRSTGRAENASSAFLQTIDVNHTHMGLKCRAARGFVSDTAWLQVWGRRSEE